MLFINNLLSSTATGARSPYIFLHSTDIISNCIGRRFLSADVNQRQVTSPVMSS